MARRTPATTNADGEQTTARLHRDWLRRLPEWTGKSRGKIADETGIARTTLADPLKKDDPGISTLSARTIDKIVRAYGVPAPSSAADMMAPKVPRGLGEDAAPYDASDAGEVAAAVRALKSGSNTIDAWTLKTRALELEGYLPGDVVLVDLAAAPQPGDAVCAQVYDWQRMKAETVMRIYESAGAVTLLLARSLDPQLHKPLVVDNERVIVKGVILPHRLLAADAIDLRD